MGILFTYGEIIKFTKKFVTIQSNPNTHRISRDNLQRYLIEHIITPELKPLDYSGGVSIQELGLTLTADHVRSHQGGGSTE